MKELNLKVKGMMCGGCENRIKRAVQAIDNVKEVEADHVTGSVTVKYENDVNTDEIKKSIEDMDFEVLD